MKQKWFKILDFMKRDYKVVVTLHKSPLDFHCSYLHVQAFVHATEKVCTHSRSPLFLPGSHTNTHTYSQTRYQTVCIRSKPVRPPLTSPRSPPLCRAPWAVNTIQATAALKTQRQAAT